MQLDFDAELCVSSFLTVQSVFCLYGCVSEPLTCVYRVYSAVWSHAMIPVNCFRHPNNPAPGTAIIIFWEVVCVHVCMCTCKYVCLRVCMCCDTELTLVYSLISLCNWMHIYQRENSCSKN